MTEERRCRRGERCSLRTPVVDDAGNTTGWQAAQLTTADGLCTACTRNVRRALAEFPELRARLDVEQLPKLAVSYREIDISNGSQVHAPIPISEYIDALGRQVDHYTATWAEFVAEHYNFEWSSTWEGQSRTGARLQRSCIVLAANVDVWLAIGPQSYLARSLTTEPWWGHDEATTTRYGGDWWCVEDGVAAAIVLLDLHRRAREITGQQASMRSPLPCRNCKARNVFREHTSLTWVCRTCGDTRSDRWHTEDAEAAARVAS